MGGDKTENQPGASAPQPSAAQPRTRRRAQRRPFFIIREDAPRWQTLSLGLTCVAACYGLWAYLTAGIPEERILSPVVIPSPAETFATFKSLWFDRALTRNTFATLRRVTLGFGLATLVGVPVGVLCGCFSRVAGFFAPLTLFGRNIPIAALIPLTFSVFGIGEFQKVMFIFIATIAFIISDTTQAVRDVQIRYVDTAYTLGANRRQVILKVLVPLSAPTVFNSLRVLFGLAFGYIMLAELIKFGGETGGLGEIIITSQRRGPREHILLVLLLIPLVAMAIDRILYWIQRELFPHQYASAGILNYMLRGVLYAWEDFKGLFVRNRLDEAYSALAKRDHATGRVESDESISRQIPHTDEVLPGSTAGTSSTEPATAESAVAEPPAVEPPARKLTPSATGLSAGSSSDGPEESTDEGEMTDSEGATSDPTEDEP